MGYYDLSAETLDAIAAAGFDVYQADKPQWLSYAFFTDGARIGYIQNDCAGLHLSTVNIPCKECGTGFSLRDEPISLTREGLERAFIIAPYWASSTDRGAVRKWKDFEAFQRGHVSPLVRTREGVKQ